MRSYKKNFKASFPQPDVMTRAIPAPTDGWDAISPLALMDPKRAVILDNMVPRPGWVEVRGGAIIWTSTFSGTPIETLMTYKSSSQQKMFAVVDNSFVDVSGNIFISYDVVGLTNNRWNYINFTPLLGTTVLQCANGRDPLYQFDGTTWSNPGITGLPFAGGANTRIIRSVWATKRRIWYVLNSDTAGTPSTVAAFMPTDAITGAIDGTQDLGGLWTKGGYLVAITDLTLDGGNGPNDYTAFISSEGQVALFSGSDPAVAGNWALAGGIFNISPPLGDRCATILGADVAIITRSGLLPLAQTLPFDPSADRSAAITSRIQNAMTSASILYGNNFGWQCITYPNQDLLFLNVPVEEGVEQQQYVMNTLTGAWCRFTGWNANCWALYQNYMFFGDNEGNVCMAYVGESDFGAPIQAALLTAFNYFEDSGRRKRMTMIQPLLSMTQTNNITISVHPDFKVENSTSEAHSQVTTPTPAYWDISFWDESYWAGVIDYVSWLSAAVTGHALAVHIEISTPATSININDWYVDPFIDNTPWDTYVSESLPIIRINAFNAVLEFGGFL